MKPSLPARRALVNFSPLSHLVVVALAAAMLAGCGESQGPQPAAKRKLAIRGSNTLGEELTPKLIAEFRKGNPDIEFDTEFKGTVYGIGALMAERCDLAAASRELTTNELALAKDRAIEFNDYVVGSYSVAVVVSPSNPVAGLTREQVRDIFTGAISNWKDLGGADAPIHVCVRDQISGTHLGFKELAMNNKDYALNAKPFTSYEAIKKTIEQDPNAIGYTSIELAATPGLKGLPIGGETPALETVKHGKYPYARTLRFITAKGKEASAAKEFAQFVQSPAGQKIVEASGFVPK